MTRADLELLWRPDPAMIGPVAPPMVLALRRPGYLEWLRCPTWPKAPPADLSDTDAFEFDDAPPPTGAQLELAL